MIIQCQSCAAKYFLPEEKVPVDPLKVRCPKCRAVFMLAGKRERVAVGAGAPMSASPVDEMISPETAAAPSPPLQAATIDIAAPMPDLPEAGAPVTEEPVVETPVVAAPTVVSGPVRGEDHVAAASPIAETAAPEVAPRAAAAPAPTSAAEPVRHRGGTKSPDDRAKRLARVLVSDILWYNRERRDAALRDGTLMTSLGEEIKKSWELYKEKVGPEAAHSTNYFKEALNEILADGQQVF